MILLDLIDLNKLNGQEIPNKTIIYQGGTQLPGYNTDTNSYNFGGPMGGDEPRVFPLCHLTIPLIKTLT